MNESTEGGGAEKKAGCVPPILSIYGKVDLIASFSQVLIVMILEIIATVNFVNQVDISTDTYAKSQVVYLTVFIFSLIFQFGVLLNAIWEKNSIQVFAHCIFNGCMFLYSIIQYLALVDAPIDDFDPADISGIWFSVIGLLAAYSLLFCVIASQLYLEFGWKIYKKIGADPNMRSMYRSYQIFVMLLKFDYFFFLVFVIQFITLVLQTDDPEFYITFVLVVLALAAMFMVVYALKNENVALVLFWTGLLLSSIGYYIFKIFRMYQEGEKQKYEGVNKFLTFFAGTALFLLIVTLFLTIVCWRNFGKGLKVHLLQEEDNQAAPHRKMMLV
eukprot:Lithocolla_globosa_v1_NODE_6815_length_1031_cov_4.356557.p1 type:complete len:329 gc:universal NODE_6815_length_1031_cov_4.356557:993-7(-)